MTRVCVDCAPGVIEDVVLDGFERGLPDRMAQWVALAEGEGCITRRRDSSLGTDSEDVPF